MSRYIAVIFAAWITTSAMGLAGDLERGKEVYTTIGACYTCHGPDGKADTPAASVLKPKPRSFALGEFLYDTDKDGEKGTETDIKNIIRYGTARYGGSIMMAARPDLSKDDVDALVAFVLSLKAEE